MHRILVVELAGSLWGSERALLDLLKFTSELDVAVCCPPGTPIIHELETIGTRVLPYYVSETHKKSRLHRLWAAIGVLRACIEFRPHLLYLNQGGAYKIVLPAATLFNLPIVSHVRIHGDADYIARLRPSPRHLRALVAISKTIKAEIREIAALNAIRTLQIYDGYARVSAPDCSTSVRRIPGRIICIGRIVPMKGQEVLIGAVGMMKKIGCKMECLIVGSGEESYVRELKQLPHAEAIQWRGTSDDVIPLLRTCSVLIVPSHREALGRVIFEAWDVGVVPVVFSGSGGAAEIIAASDGGILYDQQNPECLAGAICQAMSLDQMQVDRLVRNGRTWMATNCDAVSYGREISSILSNLASGVATTS